MCHLYENCACTVQDDALSEIKILFVFSDQDQIRPRLSTGVIKFIVTSWTDEVQY